MNTRSTTTVRFRAGWVAIALAGLMALAACGDDGDGDGDGSNGGTSSNCTHSFQCSGTTCACTTSGKEGTACCDPDDCGNDSNNCESVCRVCS